jgi:hypothetical protein
MSDLRVCFVLIDGLGVGQPDPARNPAARPDLELLSGIAGGHGSGILPLGGRLAPADACLGVEGAPQSATGHTTLLTGINAAQHLGRHQMGLPGRELRTLLAEHSVLRSCVEHGKTARFANTFGTSFFRFPREKRRRRISATTCATLGAGLPLPTIEDNRDGRSLSHDLTNAFLRDEGANLPLRSPAESGTVLARVSREHDFVLFEHFLCDRAGHDADAKLAWRVLKDLEEFLNALLGSLDLTRTVLVLASDHGNIEDLQVPAHTRNPAAVAIFGPDAPARAARVHDLTDVAPLMRTALGLPALDRSTADYS